MRNDQNDQKDVEVARHLHHDIFRRAERWQVFGVFPHSDVKLSRKNKEGRGGLKKNKDILLADIEEGQFSAQEKSSRSASCGCVCVCVCVWGGGGPNPARVVPSTSP